MNSPKFRFVPAWLLLRWYEDASTPERREELAAELRTRCGWDEGDIKIAVAVAPEHD